jgi:hypothetical protein
MLGVINAGSVPNEVPPVDALYQLIVPALAVAARVTEPVPQREAGVVLVIVGMELTVILYIDGVVAVHPFVFV